MMQGNGTIATLLPQRERFSIKGARAISLCIKDWTETSRFRDRIRIFGHPIDEPIPGLDFRPVQPVGTWFRGANRAFAEGFWQQISADPPTLVEVHNRPKIFYHLAKRQRRLRLTLHFWNDPQAQCRPEKRRAILARAAAVLCVSNYIRERFLEGLDGPAEKVHVVGAGLDRVGDALPDKENLVLFAGRICEIKGTLIFADAVTRVLGKFPDWRVAVVGANRLAGVSQQGSEKPETDYEHQVFARLSELGERTRYYGAVPHAEVMALFRRSAIVMVPSVFQEPMGRVPIEATVSGCAVIASNRGGIPEFVGKSAVILSEITSDAFAEALEDLISNPEKRMELQRQAWGRQDLGLAPATERLDTIRAAIAPELTTLAAS